MTRGELKTRVARMAGIAIGTSDDVIDDTQLLEQLTNEAVLDILTRTKIHVRRAELTLTSGTSEYEVDQIMLRLWGIQRGGNWLQEQPFDELDSEGYAFDGFNRLTFGLPGSASPPSGEVILAEYTPRPTPMTNDAHDPSAQTYGNIPSQFHLAIVNYMLWHATDRTGDQQVGRGERYRAMYEGQDGLAGPGTNLGRIKTAINMRGGAVQVKRHREVLASDRDTSYWQG